MIKLIYAKGDKDIRELYSDIVYLRRNVYSFMQRIISEVRNSTVLEIGPYTEAQFRAAWPIVRENLYIDLGNELRKNNCTYYTCDYNSNINPDFNCDFLDVEKIVGTNFFDVIIALECLEHSPRVWEIPKAMHRLLKDNGIIYISVPFYFLYHDPKPDYWRFTEDGLKLLFEDSGYFRIELEKLLWRKDDGNRPIQYLLKGYKV